MSLRPYWYRSVCPVCEGESWVSTILPAGPTGMLSCCCNAKVDWVKTDETLVNPDSLTTPPSFQNSEEELRTNSLVSIANSLLSIERLLENYL